MKIYVPSIFTSVDSPSPTFLFRETSLLTIFIFLLQVQMKLHSCKQTQVIDGQEESL